MTSRGTNRRCVVKWPSLLGSFLLLACLVLILTSCEKKLSSSTEENDNKSNALFYIHTRGRTGFINRSGQQVLEFGPNIHFLGLDNDYEWFTSSYDEARKDVEFADGVVLLTDGENLLCADSSGEIVLRHDILPNVRGFAEGLIPIHTPYSSEPPKYGYMNLKGEMVIPFQFVQADSFSEGLAVVVTWAEGRLMDGYIDKSGKFVIAPVYEVARRFSEGLAAVQVWGKYGYIDKRGNLAIPAQFERAREFYEGFAVVRFHKDKDFRSGYIDKSGQLLAGALYEEARNFSEGLAAVRVRDQWGYIDRTGKMVIAPLFDQAFDFSEGLAVVAFSKRRPFGKWDSPRYGYINPTGELVIEPRFSIARRFHHGLAWAALSQDFTKGILRYFSRTRTGYIDKAGQFVWSTTE